MYIDNVDTPMETNCAPLVGVSDLFNFLLTLSDENQHVQEEDINKQIALVLILLTV